MSKKGRAPLDKERVALRGAMIWNVPANTGTLTMLCEVDMGWFSMSQAVGRRLAESGAEAGRNTAMAAEISGDGGPSLPFVSVSGAGAGAEKTGVPDIQTGDDK